MAPYSHSKLKTFENLAEKIGGWPNELKLQEIKKFEDKFEDEEEDEYYDDDDDYDDEDWDDDKKYSEDDDDDDWADDDEEDEYDDEYYDDEVSNAPFLNTLFKLIHSDEPTML